MDPADRRGVGKREANGVPLRRNPAALEALKSSLLQRAFAGEL
jgi:hypothetical protein